MAIINASDLLVYLNFPSAIPQVTRIKILSATPFSNSGGNVNILKTTNASGIEIASLTTINASSNTGQALLTRIKEKLDVNSYAVGAVTQEGNYHYVDVTNDFDGFVSTLSVVSGTGTLEAGVVSVEVLTAGSDAGSTPIAFSTSASLNITQDFRDITNKESASFAQHLPGLKSFEMSTDALQDYSADLEFQDLLARLKTGTSVTVKFSERITSGTDQQYTGSAKVTSISMDAGVEDNLTYSATFTGTGAVTATTG